VASSGASVDRRERRNWIVILFSKAICKCYQKFSGHACHSPLATRPPANAKQHSRPPSWFSSLFPSRECDASTRRRWALHLNFGFPGASREASTTRESVIVSSFPKFQRRRDFSRVYWPLDLGSRFHFRTIWCEGISACKQKLRCIHHKSGCFSEIFR